MAARERETLGTPCIAPRGGWMGPHVATVSLECGPCRHVVVRGLASLVAETASLMWGQLASYVLLFTKRPALTQQVIYDTPVLPFLLIPAHASHSCFVSAHTTHRRRLIATRTSAARTGSQNPFCAAFLPGCSAGRAKFIIIDAPACPDIIGGRGIPARLPSPSRRLASPVPCPA